MAALHDEIRNAKTNLVFARELGDQKLIDERAQLLDELLDQVPRTAMQEIQP